MYTEWIPNFYFIAVAEKYVFFLLLPLKIANFVSAVASLTANHLKKECIKKVRNLLIFV